MRTYPSRQRDLSTSSDQPPENLLGVVEPIRVLQLSLAPLSIHERIGRKACLYHGRKIAEIPALEFLNHETDFHAADCFNWDTVDQSIFKFQTVRPVVIAHDDEFCEVSARANGQS